MELQAYEAYREAVTRIISEVKKSGGGLRDFYNRLYSEDLRALKSEACKELQEIVRQWAKRDHKIVPAVYLSDRYQVNAGMYVEGRFGTGRIVVFYLWAPYHLENNELQKLQVRTKEEVQQILAHGYAYHLQGLSHGERFHNLMKKVAHRKEVHSHGR